MIDFIRIFDKLIFHPNGASPNGKNPENAASAGMDRVGGINPTTRLFRARNITEVRQAIADGADVKYRDPHHLNWTPLHYWAERYGLTEEIIQMFETAGADLEAQDIFGKTPSQVAHDFRRSRLQRKNHKK